MCFHQEHVKTNRINDPQQYNPEKVGNFLPKTMTNGSSIITNNTVGNPYSKPICLLEKFTTEPSVIIEILVIITFCCQFENFFHTLGGFFSLRSSKNMYFACWCMKHILGDLWQSKNGPNMITTEVLLITDETYGNFSSKQKLITIGFIDNY